MSQKSINFARPKQNADDWIKQQLKDAVPTKRLSFDITEEEHRRFKIACTEQGYKFTEILRIWVNDFINEKTEKRVLEKSQNL